MIVDTETTGLPDTPHQYNTWYPASQVAHYDSARMVQLAWALVDHTFKPVDRYCALVRPRTLQDETYEFVHDGVASQINGITQQQLLEGGRDIDAVLDQFLFTLSRGVTHFVAHNAGFDWNVIRAECYRFNRQDVLTALDKVKMVCSKNETRMLVNLPGRYGPKPPKLIELYQYCFGMDAQPPGQQHQADTDVEMLRLCMEHLRLKQHPEEKATISSLT